jgi:hypothetical protein
MTDSKKLTRVVTCQGGIQLITALAAMKCRESEQKDSNYEYEDFLVIYDLYSPQGQLEEFAGFIKKMALAVSNWKGIVFIKPGKMDELADNLHASTTAVFEQIHDLLQVSQADEIYLCRNWQFGNRLLINAYRDAEKICYGDGIGFYFSQAYFSEGEINRDAGLATFARSKLRGLKDSVRAKLHTVPAHEVPKLLRAYQLLPEVDFDTGYFLLPNILGQQPPMQTRLVRKEFTEGIFRSLAQALDPHGIAETYGFISRVPTVVVMTSNFSEAARMPLEQEILAYRTFLESLKFPPQSTLIIKPHPRDSEEKIQKLGNTLGELYADVVLLTDPNLFFLPFEIFLMQALQGDTAQPMPDLKIVTFSTACLSLGVLFDFEPYVGFGSELVKKSFYPQFVSGRINHEHDLHVALQTLANVA